MATKVWRETQGVHVHEHRGQRAGVFAVGHRESSQGLIPALTYLRKPRAASNRHRSGYLWLLGKYPARPDVTRPTHAGGTMNEKEMQALLKKTMAKAAAKKNPNRPTYDKALDATRIDRPEASEDATEIFKEMKKRTF
jgi:hypothetical protein